MGCWSDRIPSHLNLTAQFEIKAKKKETIFRRIIRKKQKQRTGRVKGRQGHLRREWRQPARGRERRGRGGEGGALQGRRGRPEREPGGDEIEAR